MKKILSIVMCVALLMSVMFVIPVSAAATSDTYYMNDFENGRENISSWSDHNRVTLAAGGAYGSKYAGRVVADDYNYGSDILKYGAGTAQRFEAHSGEIFEASMLMKLETPQAADSAGQCMLILWTDGTISGTATYKIIISSFDKTSTDWQRVNFKYIFTQDVLDDPATTSKFEGIKKVEIRMNGGVSNKAADGTTKCSYLIDDLEMYIKKNDGRIKYTTSFETSDTLAVLSSGGKYTAQKVTTEAHTGAQSTLVTVNNEAGMYAYKADIRNNGANITVPVEKGTEITVTAYIKLHQAFKSSSSGTFAVMSYFNKAVDLDGDGNATNGYRFFTGKIADVTNTTDWQKITASYTWPIDTVAELNSWELRLADDNILPDGTSSAPGERKFYVDDLTIETKYVNPNACKFSSEAGETNYIGTGTNYNVATVNTTSRTGEKSALVTVANKSGMYNYEALLRKSGGANLNIAVANGDTLTISAYIKLYQAFDASSSGTFGFLSYISPAVDFDGDGNAANGYRIFTASIADVTNTTDWQKISVTFPWSYGSTTLTQWGLRLADANILPGCTTSAPGERKFYVDDLKIEITNANTKPTPPELSDVKESGTFKLGEQVGVQYDFEASGGATDQSVIKLMSGSVGKSACIATLNPGGTITVTSDMLGKEYYWEILPIASNGLYGDKVILYATKPEFGDFKIYNFEDEDTLDIEGATISENGYLGTNGLAVSSDSITFATTLDPDFAYSISAKVKASDTPVATFAMSDSNTFNDVDMTVTQLENSWYKLTLDNYNFNTANNTNYGANQLGVKAKITFGATDNYILDDIVIKPYEMEVSSDDSVVLPANGKIFDTVNATVNTTSDNVYYIFEVAENGTDWAITDFGITSGKTIPYYMDDDAAGKNLRVTVYTSGATYQYAVSNVLQETTTDLVASEIKVTNSSGKEVEDVKSGILTTTVSVYNPYDEAKTVTLYNAVYTTVPVKLAVLQPKEVTVAKGTTVITDTVDLTDVSHYSQYTHCLKTFVWNEYIPIGPSKETAACELIDGAVYNMYIDESIETVEGIVMMNQHGESGSYATNAKFRQFCKERNLAIFDFYDGAAGNLKYWHNEDFAMEVLNTKIAEIAYKTGHPELNYVPIATLGHSNGCVAAGRIAKLNPERTFAVLCFKSAYPYQFEFDELVEAKVPVFIITGETDWDWGYHGQIHAAERIVKAGGVATYVQQKNAGHGNMTTAEDIMLAFLDEAYKAKVKNATVVNGVTVMPEIDLESGYIGYGTYTETVEPKWNYDANGYVDETVYVYENPTYIPYAEAQEIIKNDSSFLAQSWLFNEDFAKKWVNFINKGTIN